MRNSMASSVTSASISPAVLQTLKAEKVRRLTENKLQHYRPYPRQGEFHAAGLTVRERLLMAESQSGKTWAGACEVAMHACGKYPPTGGRADGLTDQRSTGLCHHGPEVARDTVQRSLVGRPGQEGSGAIPKDMLAELVPSRG